MTALNVAPRRRFSLRGRIWPLVGVAAVSLLWIISAAANYHAGASLSSDFFISHIIGSASVGADLMKAVAIFAVVAAIANRRPVVMLAGLVIFCLCATWSMRSAIYFVSTTLTQTVSEKTLKRDLQQSQLGILDLKIKRAGFLSQQSLKVDTKNKSARRDAISENQRSSGEFTGLIKDIEAQQKDLAATPVATGGDPIAALFGLTDRTVILASALFFALLLEVVSGLGFWVIASSRQAKIINAVAMPVPAPVAAPVSIGGDGGTSGYGQIGYGGTPPGAEVVEGVTPAPTAAAPAPATNVVPMRRENAMGDRFEKVKSIVDDRFAAAPLTERILMSSVVAQINAGLPIERRVPEPQRAAELLVPIVFQMYPRAEKRKVGGRTFIYGVSQRLAEDARRAM